MIDMTAVDREIQAARAELADTGNVKGILSLPTRKRIWRAMLDPDDDEVSYQHRIRLKVACVRHVLPVWYRGFPGDQRVEEMIALTQDLMDRRTMDTDQARMTAGTLLADVIDEAASDDVELEMDASTTKPNSIKNVASLVADAASLTVFSACHRDPDMDLWEEYDDMVDDDELLPDTLESSYSCASAAAGALNWQPLELTDVPARRAFWTWYLDEAIPTTLAT
ncbi:Imm5 family immunity protein [uncultured Actinomyces sp.]|uniref:Imm5 family immunity protein n=1 Tax=uncultured Actinomyces sp. TaxID=249061 RepID=UPI00261630C0|nr:Imm5 family immunity protein [uncultured Actinomyces sp.]